MVSIFHPSRSRRSRSRHRLKVHGTHDDDNEDDNNDDIQSSTPATRVSADTRPAKRARHQPPSASSVADTDGTNADTPNQPSIKSTINHSSSYICGVCTLLFHSAQLLELHLAGEHPHLSSGSTALIEPDDEDEDDEDDTAGADVYHLDPISSVPFASSSSSSSAVRPPRPRRIFSCTHLDSDGVACSKTFHYQNVLDNHIRAIHTKETPFACATCDKRFPTRARQVAHQARHLKLVMRKGK